MDLFDGRSLDGWVQINGKADYAVVDGAIVGTTVEGSPNSFLCTEEYFGDFELEFDVKLHDAALNSGVQIRSHAMPEYKKGRFHGYQVEIATNGHAGFIYDEARRGWLSTDYKVKERQPDFRNDDWNHYRIRCEGSRLRTWVNGKAIEDLRDDWSATGRIGLQVHSVRGDPKYRVAWRNLRIRRLGDGGGWSELINGTDLDGWRVNENPDSVTVKDGAIEVCGPRAHVFYSGPVMNRAFRNFELVASVRTEPNANSGLYFHTAFQESGWPQKGYEVQINNSQSDWRRTGGLYGIEDLREPPAVDGEWFEMRVTVDGSRIRVAVHGKTVVDYVEPDDAQRPEHFAGRLLGSGTFALQCHDPGSRVAFRSLKVRPLP